MHRIAKYLIMWSVARTMYKAERLLALRDGVDAHVATEVHYVA